MQNAIDLAKKLEEKKGFDLKMLIGLDGFVDEIIHVVDKRQDFKNFTRIRTIGEFGERIAKAAGLSTNIEMVTVQTKLGGNGPILSNALIEYGVRLTYAGALGVPEVHPVFKPLADRAEAVYSVCAPGQTDACEFEDGKVMFGKHSTLSGLTWDVFKNGFGGVEKLSQIVANCDVFGMENWTMMPAMSEVWQGLIDEVFPLLPWDSDGKGCSNANGDGVNGSGAGRNNASSGQKPLAFFDLADPEKRTKADIKHAMELIGRFEEKFRVILGLNEKEVYEIAAVLDLLGGKDSAEEIAALAKDPNNLQKTVMAVYDAMGIYCLMVHPVRSACCAIGGEYFFTDGPFCAKPKLTTGAGDNLNAGFCLAQALGLSPQESLTLGVCTSGFYVRNAKSPTFDEVIGFAKAWGAGEVE